MAQIKSRHLKLKDNHPTMVKFLKLCDLAEELGISIYWQGQRVFLTDSDRDPDLPHLELMDIEGEDYWISEFPPTTEFKVIFEDPDLLEQERKEREDRLAEEKQREELAKAAKEKELARQREEARQAKEAQERKLLSELKAKYESGVVKVK